MSSTISIPHSQNAVLVGTLQKIDDNDTHGKPIALILHGVMGHRDYLFLKKLAHQLPLDSFRFDFRGNNESSGDWAWSGFDADTRDIQVVVAYLQEQFGYVVRLVIGHSRGAFVGMKWMCTSEEAIGLAGFVNVSGRYRTNKYFDFAEKFKPSFEERGYHDMTARVAGKTTTKRVYPEDIPVAGKWSTSYLDNCPSDVDCLTIHGLSDEVVPPFDGLLHARHFASRTPGTSSVHMVEGAGHNFINYYEEVIETILAWWARREAHTLVDGIWSPDIRTRL